MPSAMTLRHLKNRKKVSETECKKLSRKWYKIKGKQPRAQFTWP